MPNFEEQLTALESVVERLERGDLPLEESVKLFEEGLEALERLQKRTRSRRRKDRNPRQAEQWRDESGRLRSRQEF